MQRFAYRYDSLIELFWKSYCPFSLSIYFI